MAIRVQIPTPLRKFACGARETEVEGRTVREALSDLVAKHPDLRQHLYDDAGNLRNFVNVFVGDEAVSHLDAPLEDGSTLLIVPSIAGGESASTAPPTTPRPPVSPSPLPSPPPLASGPLRDLTAEEVRRYSRHIILPEVGMEGQKRLAASSVLLIGAGGLGSPLGMYLAAAGVGRIGIVDRDTVDESNLQRQVIHGTKDVGRSKLESAKETITDINPHVAVETYETTFRSDNALRIAKEYDVIIDGTDNFPTRYLSNDVSVFLGKPNVYGSIFRFEGQAAVFYPKAGGPCYRCLYPEPPPPGMVPSCAEGGVIGILPGIVGLIQANEAVKLLLGIGEPLIGRLLLFDALAMRFRELKLRRNPDCPVCGDHPTITEPIDYEQFCGIPRTEAAEGVDDVPSITVEAYKALRDEGRAPFLLDVREPNEYEIANLGGKLIPLGELPRRFAELDANEEIVVHCKSGARSAKAVKFLREHGFKNVRNLTGGIIAWSEKIDPTLPKY